MLFSVEYRLFYRAFNKATAHTHTKNPFFGPFLKKFLFENAKNN